MVTSDQPPPSKFREHSNERAYRIAERVLHELADTIDQPYWNAMFEVAYLAALIALKPPPPSGED